MRSRLSILIAIVVLVAVVLVVGVAVAGAGRSDPLPAVTAPELLARMAQAKDVDAVSGEIAWKNGLFGDLGQVGAMAHLPAQSPLTSSGSGRLWLSDAGVKVESQGSGGDQVVVVDKSSRTVWVYDYARNTAQKMVVTGSAPAETASPAPDAFLLTPQTISLYLGQLASFATIEVAGQARVAGRDAYQLRFTPADEDTAVGFVQAAVDGETMLPLQLEVYAKGGTVPVLKTGFTSVSYEPVAPSAFAFKPPEGAKVTTKTVDADQTRAQLEQLAEQHRGDKPDGAQRDKALKAVQGALLERGEVAELVPYDLAYAREYAARPYRVGFVLGEDGPLTSGGVSLAQLLGTALGIDPGAAGTLPFDEGDSGPAPSGASSVLLYGEGLGTIVLVQTQTTPELRKQLEQARRASEILGSTTVNGVRALEVGTPLGGVVVWQQGGTTLLAGGLVPMDDLEAFTSSVR